MTDSKKRVLVLDDNEDTAAIFALLIERMGYAAQALYHPSNVLAQVRAFRPDIVFLDIHMPHKDGYAVAREIRAEFGYDAIKIVAVTGSGDDDARKRAGAAGFDAHVHKPVDHEIIAAILKTLGGD